MKFRTKLFYSFISLGLISTLLALFIIYGEASQLIFNEIRSKVLSLASNTAYIIQSEELEQFIEEGGNTHSSSYHNLKEELLKIRNLNRRSDVFVEYVYIIRKNPQTGQYTYVLDTTEGQRFATQFGEAAPIQIESSPQEKKAFVNKNIYSDRFGSWLSGFAPILDEKGEEVALLGIDVRTREIYVELERLLLYGLIAFVISIAVGIGFAFFLSRLVTSSLAILCEAVEKIGQGIFSTRSELKTQDEFHALSDAINKMAKGLEERERLKSGFARYVSQYALEELLELDKPISLEGERKKVTVLFSDIRRFTTIAEKLSPEEVLSLLNEYFEEMIEIIFNYGGTLDKFIGDGLMVEFGAPLDDKLQEVHAVLAALHMQIHLEQLGDRWEKQGKKRLSMGVGIHTGLAVLGNIGSERRMEYTAIGDTVNVASRLESISKKLKKPIIISQSVYDKVKDHFECESLNEVELPGRSETLHAYAIYPEKQKNLHQVDLTHEIHELHENYDE